jgi:hypothetical protein
MRRAVALLARRASRNKSVSGRARITPPSSGQTTAGGLVPLRQQCARRCLPLMSNVSRHMQSCRVNGSAVKARAALHQCAVQPSAVGSRKAQLARRLCRAVRPAAAGAPIVEASPEQRSASCRAVRPSAASAPVRKRARIRRSARPRSRIFNTRGKQHALFAPALRVRSACAASFLRCGRHRPCGPCRRQCG